MKLLSCPECYATFRLPSSAIGDEGRQVRCSSCGHEWLANRLDLKAADNDVDDDITADDVTADAEATDTDIAAAPDNTDDTAEGNVAEDEATEPQQEGTEPDNSDNTETDTAEETHNDAESDLSDMPDFDMDMPGSLGLVTPEAPKKPRIVGFVAATIVCTLISIAIALIMWRGPVMSMLPFTASLYHMIGYHPTDTLKLGNLVFARSDSSKGTRFSIKGTIHNGSDLPVPTPTIRARLYDKEGELLEEWLLSKPDILRPSESKAFNAKKLRTKQEGGHVMALDIGSPLELTLRK